MKNYFNIVLCCVLPFVLTSFACHSMNGVSKKAILLGIQKNVQATVEPEKDETAPQMGNKSQSANLTLQNQPTTAVPTENFVNDSRSTPAAYNRSSYFDSSEPRHINELISYKTNEIIERQKNISQEILIAPLNESSESINISLFAENVTMDTSKDLDESAKLKDEKSAELESLFNFGRHYPARLMQERGLIVDEPGVRSENKARLQRSMPPMQPPLSDMGQPDEAMLEDDKVKKDWGGDCGVEHWKSCNNITTVGDETMVHPDFPYDPKKNIMTQLDCFEPMKVLDFPWLCLTNGWTVNRCHILCMSKCNRELLRTRNFDAFVLHEGSCKTKK